MGWWDWLIDPVHAAEVGAIGLIGTGIGFLITFWQLWVTKKAAQAASEAANLAKARLNTFSALRECENAKRQMELVMTAIGKAEWQDVITLSQPVVK